MVTLVVMAPSGLFHRIVVKMTKVTYSHSE
jgi:hypothetical protein